MRSRVSTFLLVGVIVTIVDVSIFMLLYDRSVLLAEVLALSSAAACSYILNRTITFSSDQTARWVSEPSRFLLTAVVAGMADILLVFTILQAIDTALVVKLIAVALSGLLRWSFYRTLLFRKVRTQLATRQDRPSAPGDYRFTVLLPAYNEGERIEEAIDAINSHFDEISLSDYEILVVDDGSADNTADLAEARGARVVREASNQGKGAAVRSGLKLARGRSVIFMDSDLAYPPELIPSFLSALEDGWDVVVGSRRHVDSVTEVETSFVRKAGGWGINKLTHVVLLGQFRDTQCGIKGFRSDVGASLAERGRINRFGFDIELFIMAEQDELSLIELPIILHNRPGSSVSLVRDTKILIGDLIKIRRYAGRGYYSND